MNVKLKYFISIFSLIIIFIATEYLLVPYAQKSVNSHTGGSDFFSILFNLIALIIFIRLIVRLYKKVKSSEIIIIIAYFITFIYLGYKFYNLVCYGCSQG
ncbi:hypothetical protein FAQ01_27100 [Flavobacterium aquatile]|nr:hypothetical protein FAQ01_27100 [Flavobacterium aquatile]